MKDLDKNIFEELCHIQCTQKEIASVFRVHPDTVRDWVARAYGEDFSTIYEKFSDDGKASLRRIQFKHAEKSVPMAIWLGKQWLNQRDRISTAIESDEESKELMQAFIQEIKTSGKSKES